MALTVAQCADWIKLALGGKPDAVLSTLELVNLSGAHFCGMSDWRFLKRRSSYLSTVSGQDYIDLPTDFGGFISLAGVGFNIGDRPSDLDEINRMRNSSSIAITGQPYQYAVVDTTPSGSDPGETIIELFPTPTASTANAFSLVYRARWAQLTSESDYVPIKDYCKELFLRVLWAHANGWQRDGQGSLSKRLAEIAVSPEFVSAVRQDRAMQKDIGELQSQLPAPNFDRGSIIFTGTITGP